MTTVQDLFMTFYPKYKETYTPSLEQAKAANDIIRCRMAELGGHAYECESCGHTQVTI